MISNGMIDFKNKERSELNKHIQEYLIFNKINVIPKGVMTESEFTNFNNADDMKKKYSKDLARQREERIGQAKIMISRGLTMLQICGKLGISIVTLVSYLGGGEYRKLAIKELYNNGETMDKIRYYINVSEDYIKKVVEDD